MSKFDDYDEQDIAIVGMACRFPGANSPEEFWRNLESGVESVKFYEKEDLKEAGVSPSLLNNPNYVAAGAPLDEMEFFDPEFFGFSPKEAGILDPQHRHFYECAWEALESSGHIPSQFDGAIGVFAGCGMGAYFAYNLITNPDLVESVGPFLLRHTGNDKDFLSTRVSYSFNLQGPSVNVQTACSTSLVATHLACQSLLSGESDMALAGGSTIELPHHQGYLYKEGEILSPDGHCRSFDHRSKGTIFGSGIGAVVLRRMEDAIADRDQIYAVIKGTVINNDGASKVGYLAPSVDGQAAAVAEALAIAGVEADDVDYVECHGTGTPVGDPIEVSALTQAFRESTTRNGYCRIGSVKSNIGHLDTAAGVASLMKAALSLQYGKIPASLNFEAPNPTIDFSASPFVVNAELTEYKKTDKPAIAAVNSLGVGGTNAFAVLQSPGQYFSESEGVDKSQLLVISAKSRSSLDAYTDKFITYLRQDDTPLFEDIAYTLLTGREKFEHRKVLGCKSAAEAADLLESSDPQRVYTYHSDVSSGELTFMFPGGGAQYLNMAKDLYDSETVFKGRMDRGFKYLIDHHDFDLKPIIFPATDFVGEADKLFDLPSAQLPAIFLTELALVDLWKSVGIEPDALVGHSMGENTAACVSGIMGFEDALGLVRLRGCLMDDVPAGGMLSVELDAQSLKKELFGELDIASINSPLLSVASGSTEEINQLSAALDAKEIPNQLVRINIAAHSRMLENILEPFRDYLKSISLSKPNIPIVSNYTGTWLTDQQATDPDYWVQHLRNSVKFSDCIQTLLKNEENVLLEVGPGNTLSSLAKHQPQAKPQRIISTLRHQDMEVEDNDYFLTVLGRLWMAGINIDSSAIWQGEARSRVAIPTYAFNHKRYWIEPGKSDAVQQTLVGSSEKNPDFDEWFYQPVWVQQGLLNEPVEQKDTWLMFHDDDGIAERLKVYLLATGNRVISVYESDAFYQINDMEYRLSPEHGADGYASLLRCIAASGISINRILHAWLLTTKEAFRPGSSFFHRNLEHGFYSLMFLAKAIVGEQTELAELHWVVLTNGMMQVKDEKICFPEKATSLGPCRVIPREIPGSTCVAVDLDIAHISANRKSRKQNSFSLDDDLLALLKTEIDATPESATIAFRSGTRWQQKFQKLPAERIESSQPVLRENGVYLITGGTGGVGDSLARYLSKNYKAKIVLLSRTPLPERDSWGTWLKNHDSEDPITRKILKLQSLEAMGAETLSIAADVTNIERMQEAIDTVEKELGKINGVFHAAGVIRDSLIPVKTQADVEEVFAPKIYGTMVLSQAFKDYGLDFIMLYSSTSTAIAPMGQVDYVGANAFMNAVVHSSSFNDARTVVRPLAVNWGIWNEVGMAADAARKMTLTSNPKTDNEKPQDCKNPLFGSRYVQFNQENKIHYISFYLSPEADWLLDEHRTKAGEAILPGTAYIEYLNAALREVGESTRFEIRNLLFVKALYVAEKQTRHTRIKLKQSSAGYHAEVQSSNNSVDGAQGWELHAEAELVASKSAPPQSIDLSQKQDQFGIESSKENLDSLQSDQEVHLRFGPRWRVLKQFQLMASEAMAELKLSEAFVADLDYLQQHPAIIDLATGYAMSLIEGYDAKSGDTTLWVPVSYQRIQFFKRIPQHVWSHVEIAKGSSVDAGFARFNITLYSTEGEVLAKFDELTIKKMEAEIQFSTLPPPLTAELELEVETAGTGEVRQLSPTEQIFQHNISQGILPDEGALAIERVLEIPNGGVFYVSSMDLHQLISEQESLAARSLQQESTKFSRPELETDFIAPSNDIERVLVAIWQDLLGIDQVGVEDNFFDLGGHSLVAVRLFAKVRQQYDIDYPISVLFQAPTIKACAEMLIEELGHEDSVADSDQKTKDSDSAVSRYNHLVPMHGSIQPVARPFFLVAGMFGNVLNLRHLANLVGTDREFYGLQARGLYGEQTPHTTFEEMAKDYIAELQSVQPEGPYYLGGFSGGGITAYEMARQLREQGHKIALLVLLDTPLPTSPPLSSVDRMSIHLQRIRKQGSSYFAEWAKNRYKWEMSKFEKRFSDGNTSEQPFDFQSESIEVAFYEALERYQIAPQPLKVDLFRPKLDERYQLSGGRVANADREIVLHDNGWSPLVDSIDVHIVPGDHDSMVLEPNVRVLATELRTIIEESDVDFIE